MSITVTFDEEDYLLVPSDPAWGFSENKCPIEELPGVEVHRNHRSTELAMSESLGHKVPCVRVLKTLSGKCFVDLIGRDGINGDESIRGEFSTQLGAASSANAFAQVTGWPVIFVKEVSTITLEVLNDTID